MQPFTPGQNLERRIPSDGDTIFSYAFDQVVVDGIVKDTSKNGYNGNTACKTEQGTLKTHTGLRPFYPMVIKGP